MPEGKREVVLEILEDEGIDYVVSDETSGRGYAAVVRFPVPTRAVEPLLDRLKRAGIGDEASVVVINAETVLSEQFSTLRDRYSRGGQLGARTSRQVLRTKADELTPPFSIYTVMLTIEANWEDPSGDDANVDWARAAFAEVERLPVASGRYGNFPGLNEDPVERRFGDNYERLVDLKTEYDPTNLFGTTGTVAPRTAAD